MDSHLCRCHIVTPANNEYTKIEAEITGMPIIEREDFVEASSTGGKGINIEI